MMQTDKDVCAVFLAGACVGIVIATIAASWLWPAPCELQIPEPPKLTTSCEVVKGYYTVANLSASGTIECGKTRKFYGPYQDTRSSNDY